MIIKSSPQNSIGTYLGNLGPYSNSFWVCVLPSEPAATAGVVFESSDHHSDHEDNHRHRQYLKITVSPYSAHVK